MTDQPSATSPKAATPKPKKKKRRLLKVLATLFILLLVFIALLPTLVSTGFGTGMVLSFVNKGMPGTVEIDDLNVGWFSSTSIKSMRLKDPDGEVVLAATVDAPNVTLISLIRGDMAIGDATLTADEVNIEQYKDGTTNLERALGPSDDKKDEKDSKFPKGLNVNFTLNAPKATYKPYDQEPAILTDAKLNVKIAGGKQIGTTLVGFIQQGDLKGRIQIATDLKDLFDEEGNLQWAKLHIQMEDNKLELPTQFVDNFSKSKGKLAAIAGSKINATYSAIGTLSDLKTKLNLSSERLQITANASVQLDDNQQLKGLTLDDGELVHVKITKDTWNKFVLTVDAKEKPAVEFVRADDLVITNTKVSVKPGANGIDLDASTATFSVAPMKITVKDAKLGERTLSLNAFKVDYDGPNHTITTLIEANTGEGTETGTLVMDVKASNPFHPDGTPNYEKLELTVDAEVKEFALSLLDELFMTDGLLGKVVGKKLNATAKLDLKPTAAGNEGTWSVIAKASQLDASLKGPVRAARKKTDAGVTWDKVVMSLSEPGRVSTKLSKPVLQLLKEKVKGIDKALDRTDLTDKTVTLTISKLEAPLDKSLLANAKADLAVLVDPFTVDLNTGAPGTTGNPNLNVQLQNLTATAVFAGNAQPVKVGLSSLAKHAGKAANLKVDVAVADLFDEAGKLDTDTLTAVVTANLSDLPTSLVDTYLNQTDLAKQGFGDTINIAINANTKLKKAGDTYDYDGSGLVNIKSTTADVQLTGKLVGDRLQLNVAPTASYAKLNITPAFIEALKASQAGLPADYAKLKLAGNADLSVVFTQANFPMTGDLKTARFGATATIAQLALTGDPRFDNAKIENLVVTIKDNTVGDKVDLNVNGDLLHLDQSGKLAVNALVTQPLSKQPGINATVQLLNAPTALADAFAGMDGLIGALEGKSIERVALNFKRSSGAKDNFGAEIKSQAVVGGVGGTYDPGKRFDMNPNQSLTVNITPAAWAIVQKRFPEKLPENLRGLKLLGPASVTAKLDVVSLALAEVKIPTPIKKASVTTQSAIATAVEPAPAIEQTATKIIAADSRVLIRLSADGPFVQRGQSNRAVKFEDVAMKLDGSKSLNDLNVLVTATPVSIPLINGKPVDATSPQAGQIRRGKLKVEGVAKNLSDKNGHFATSKLALKGTAEAKDVPVIELDEALGQEGKLVAIFGDIVNLNGSVDTLPGKPGGFGLKLDSGNATATVDGLLTDNVVTLKDDAKVELKVTPEMSDVLLKSVLVIVKAVSSDTPATLTVPAKGFAIPLNQGEGDMIDMKKVQAGAVLKLGTLQLEKSGPLAQVLSLLGSAMKQFKSAGGNWVADFSPGDIALKNGIVTYNKPMTMSLNKIKFVFNGSVDLNTRSIADLNVSIAGDTFGGIKELRGVLGPNSLIPLPLGGTVDNPVLDGKKLQKEFFNLALKAGLNAGLGELIPGGKGGIPGLDGLFKPKNQPAPKQPDGNQPNNDGQSNTDANKKPDAKDAAFDLLRGVLGGKPQPKQPEKKKDDEKTDDEEKNDSNTKGDDGKGLLDGLIGPGSKKKDDAKKE